MIAYWTPIFLYEKERKLNQQIKTQNEFLNKKKLNSFRKIL
jgi:hypothetical protein